jgi:hypothetical protein
MAHRDFAILQPGMVEVGNCHGQFVEENLRAFLEGDTVPP